jgi:hypothetical protein
MDFDQGERVSQLRERLRVLIAQHMPDWYHGPFKDDAAVEATERFCRVLADEHLLTIDWPQEWGGEDAGVWEQAAVREEMWAHDEPRGAQYMGLSWVGPAIMRHGTAEQKAMHLPLIGRGEVTWCQGFSEPEAGSDLASLKLAATPQDGGGWRLDGQKIWTSYASLAQWCFLAARTDPAQRRQQGLTIFLVPLHRPGVEVRPIASMMGDHHLNEIFFEGVEVGPEDVLGEVDGGWDVIRTVLSFERIGIPRYARSDRMLSQLWPTIAAEPASAPLRQCTEVRAWASRSGWPTREPRCTAASRACSHTACWRSASRRASCRPTSRRCSGSPRPCSTRRSPRWRWRSPEPTGSTTRAAGCSTAAPRTTGATRARRPSPPARPRSSA